MIYRFNPIDYKCEGRRTPFEDGQEVYATKFVLSPSLNCITVYDMNAVKGKICREYPYHIDKTTYPTSDFIYEENGEMKIADTFGLYLSDNENEAKEKYVELVMDSIKKIERQRKFLYSKLPLDFHAGVGEEITNCDAIEYLESIGIPDRRLNKIKSLIESKLHLDVSDLIKRFVEVDKYFNGSPWNLYQIINNLLIMSTPDQWLKNVEKVRLMADASDEQ